MKKFLVSKGSLISLFSADIVSFRKLKIIIIIFLVILTNQLISQEQNDKPYVVKYITGVSYSLTGNDTTTLKFIGVREQVCFEIKNFPIILFFEPNVFIGLTKEKPNAIASLLFGFRKEFLSRHGLTFSYDFGSGIALGINDKDNGGVAGRFGVDIAYKDVIFRLVDMTMFSGFNYKGLATMSLGYAF
jgi:hypothetical protein